MERLLLRDRAGPSRVLPRNVAATGDHGAIARDIHALLSGSPHEDATGAVASAAAAAGRRKKMIEGGATIRHPTPQHVKAVMSLTCTQNPNLNAFCDRVWPGAASCSWGPTAG